MLARSFGVGILFGLMLAACAGATFPYKYYGIDLEDSKLLGPKPSDDVELAVCKATAGNQAPCVAMMSDEFLSLKKDYMDAQNQLSACQHQLAGSGK